MGHPTISAKQVRYTRTHPQCPHPFPLPRCLGLFGPCIPFGFEDVLYESFAFFSVQRSDEGMGVCCSSVSVSRPSTSKMWADQNQYRRQQGDSCCYSCRYCDDCCDCCDCCCPPGPYGPGYDRVNPCCGPSYPSSYRRNDSCGAPCCSDECCGCCWAIDRRKGKRCIGG